MTLLERRVRRLSAAFLIETANLSRAESDDGLGDMLEPLVFAAVVQANQAALVADPTVRARYGDTGETLPDELRRPISVAAVADSLRLSYETTRRRVMSLARQGLCVVTPDGCYVPRAVIEHERHAAVQRARLARLVRLHDDLAAVGFLGPGETWTRPPSVALIRPANRALSQYMLRTLDGMVRLAGGVLDAFVLLGLSAYAERRPAGADEADEAAPISALALARRLGLGDETVRRHLKSLAAKGFARRPARGWVLAFRRAHERAVADIAAQNEAELRRLFARLKQLAEA